MSAALAIINDVLGEVLDGEEAELDADTRFALTWFAEHGYNPGPSGDADSVARAKNTSLDWHRDCWHRQGSRRQSFACMNAVALPTQTGRRCMTTGSRCGRPPSTWRRHWSARNPRLPSCCTSLGGHGDRARQLAYLLYQKANDKGWASEAGVYNGLITAWPNLRTGAATVAAAASGPAQQALL